MVWTLKLGIFIAGLAMFAAAIPAVREGFLKANRPLEGWVKGNGRIVDVKPRWRGSQIPPAAEATIEYQRHDSAVPTRFVDDCSDCQVGNTVTLTYALDSRAAPTARIGDGRDGHRFGAMLLIGLGILSSWAGAQGLKR